ncbi:MAG: tRNA (N6-threonylcarbamoyladenosine(37)-N6)-methyltransferase TrmO [Geminicoccaceae bacterium]|nr:tRNA (N6-threonylcarbamoyladenosine(37)-N6)-methyltransferase TrmO [Geminicoccaceae bacterium]MCB9968498.1 tRNA (N6-threonylcarbamoyladenosine(37)-N6)-methyltransferase TrmO [Geminicoccaceae bacterium]HRY24959.1 tRNA (N6-threonylcarbamoyladenosine(37)-N6)-methyltransferase TrmO [Geminicoccaceae bacterium]
MTDEDTIRPGEVAVEPPEASDAGLVFIGRIRTPWTTRASCPRQGRLEGPLCRIELFHPWGMGLAGIERHERLEVLYWLDRARRDILLQSPARDGRTRGVFSLRSPVRPNPIGTSIVRLERVEGLALLVRGLDCLDLTPLLDLKPDRTLFTPAAPAKSTVDETS